MLEDAPLPGPAFPLPPAPLLLVCTHGRRDACCAQFGRPTAMALARRYGTAVWETTHVGGDRFALPKKSGQRLRVGVSQGVL